MHTPSGFKQIRQIFRVWAVYCPNSTNAIERATDDAFKNLDLALGDLIENIKTQQLKDGT